MIEDTIPLFSFPAVQGKKVRAAFDDGRMSFHGGVILLSLAERRLGVAERLARCIPDRRDLSRIAHTIADMISRNTPVQAVELQPASELLPTSQFDEPQADVLRTRRARVWLRAC
jgi:hypothetical protein